MKQKFNKAKLIAFWSGMSSEQRTDKAGTVIELSETPDGLALNKIDGVVSFEKVDDVVDEIISLGINLPLADLEEETKKSFFKHNVTLVEVLAVAAVAATAYGAYSYFFGSDAADAAVDAAGDAVDAVVATGEAVAAIFG